MASEATAGASGSTAKFGRIALILAALVALVAVGIVIARNRGGDSPMATATPGAAAAPGSPVGDVDSMIGQLEARLKQNPEDVAGWSLLGRSFMVTNRFAEAATAYDRATKLAPDNVENWSAKGEALVYAAGDKVPPEALAAFGEALKRDPKDARARYYQGVDKYYQGDKKGAVDAWLAVLGDTPAGADWEAGLRERITEVAAEAKIDVSKQLAAVGPAAPLPSTATDGIPGPSREQMAAATQLPPGQQDAMVNGMVEGLEAKLKANPRDEAGWIRLMRSRMVLNQPDRAGAALQSGLAAFGSDSAVQNRLRQSARQLGVPGA
ncbi:cytochrome c-type biogenesis protein CcmH [Sphingomonas zeicaulis]|uniref:tetratricopeptide repeat protein n=1 Tax=Sphingomonas zeicaulis TaxID=1632740 RepID=UPI003D20FEF9